MMSPPDRAFPTAAQLAQTQQAIAAHIKDIATHPERREGAYPYSLWHEAGQPIWGTVLMFHGFSAKPHQMWRLADYLFRNGFNVYQCNIAGHTLINPAVNWPQVDLKPEYAKPLKAKALADPVIRDFVQKYRQHPASPGPLQQAAIIRRLMTIEPQVLDMIQAIQQPDHPAFDRYYTSSHLDYLTDARDRLNELAALPGPIYTVGLSVGGAVALGLAADQPERIERVVAYAPLLEVYGRDRRAYVEITGPLDLEEIGWDPALQFPVGCLTATDRFGGSEVRSRPSIRALQGVATLLVLTENEDAADIQTNQRFFEQIGGAQRGHALYLYPAAAQVPHPMVDPTEVSQGMSNRFWQSLYQETFRFLVEGKIHPPNFSSLKESVDLPPVPPVN